MSLQDAAADVLETGPMTSLAHDISPVDQNFVPIDGSEKTPNEPNSERKMNATPETVSGKEQRPQTAPSSGWLPGTVALLAAGVAGAGLLLLRRSKRKSEPSVPRTVSDKRLFSEVLALRTPSVPLLPGSPQDKPLADLTFVVSDRVDVVGVRTRIGSDQWQETQKPCTVSAPLVDSLVAKGATGIAVVPTQLLGCQLPIDKSVRLPNPIGQGHTPGGGEYGPAIAVASHKTDLAIAVDENGSALIPAACTGIYAYRPTAGVLPLEGAAAASATLGTTCLLGHDPKALVRAGRALGLPGAQNTVTVVQYLVAEDIFGLCDPEVQRSAPAVVSAVRRWAGADQAKALNLTEWLFHRIPSLRTFLPPPGEKETVTGKAQTEQVLDALFGAAHAVQVWEWQRSGHGAWVAANKATMPTFLTKTLDLAGDLTEKRYNEAIAVAEELSAAMRAALQEGYVFVMPTVPGPAPRTSGPGAAEKMTAFIERSFRFAALASLAGVPQVVIPMPTAGSLPLSISCVSLQRRDLLLLQAAAKLGPMLAEAAAKLDAPETAPKKPSASSSGKKSDANGVGAANPALAEGAKEQGNTAFNAGRYDEAVRRYSEAIQLNPKMAVYYSNRAMANLKLGQYGAAEEDCDAALKLDPTLVKALLRRGSARLAQGNVKDARDDFTRVLTLEPRNKQAVEELRRLGRESESYATSSFSFA